jgi:hypothetical protein
MPFDPTQLAIGSLAVAGLIFLGIKLTQVMSAMAQVIANNTNAIEQLKGLIQVPLAEQRIFLEEIVTWVRNQK